MENFKERGDGSLTLEHKIVNFDENVEESINGRWSSLDQSYFGLRSEYFEGLSSPMGSMIAAAVSDPMRNDDNFIKKITLQRDYHTCAFNRYDVEAIFHLKPIINYRLELMRSLGFKEFYDNIVECVIMKKSKREKIRSMAGVNVDEFQMYDDGGVYEIFEQLLTSKYKINSYNVLFVMEMYRHRPGYILTDLISNQ
ncbi:hypothetical protein FQA39_LY11074 [Lamprigera yunnana]|nr:hypothetical protein FQA39_LY11074 [Lamprigera yunnana]